MPDTSDTIVALCSAVGGAGRGVVRLSGTAAPASADRVFFAADDRRLSDTPGYRRVEGFVRLGAVRFPASALVFRGPRSYTAEDVVELHLPGSPPVLAKLLETLQSAPGVRAAAPGEFTARAFLNGRLDLSQAEGVLSVIRSRSAADLRAARQLLDGAVSRVAGDIRGRLVGLLAELEAGIDFVEEDIEFISRGQMRADLADIAARLDDGLARGRDADALDTRARVVLIGRPNVGKSSLLNALTGRDRSIVADRPGTTRDPVSGVLTVGGMEITLLDTAGVGGVAAGLPDELAQAATAEQRGTADLIVLVLDGSVGFTPEDWALWKADPPPALVVANKLDLGVGRLAADICVSARTGAGLDELKARLVERLGSEALDRGEGTLGLNARHRAAMTACREAVARAAEAEATELIALELREAAWHIGAIAGEVVADDILGEIFSRFCVGK